MFSPPGGRPEDRNPLIQNEAASEEAHHPPVAQPEAGAAPEDVWLKVGAALYSWTLLTMNSVKMNINYMSKILTNYCLKYM